MCGSVFDAFGGSVCRLTGEAKPICSACMEKRRQKYKLENNRPSISNSVEDNLTDNAPDNSEMIDNNDGSQVRESKKTKQKKQRSKRKSNNQPAYYETGKSRPPSLNYEAALERKRRRDAQTGGIPEFEEGYPRDEFGTRDEHKKMRGRDWGDMKRRSRE